MVGREGGEGKGAPEGMGQRTGAKGEGAAGLAECGGNGGRAPCTTVGLMLG